MDKSNCYFFLLLIVLHTPLLLSMQERYALYSFPGKKIPSHITNPKCVAWLADDTIALGGDGGSDIFDPHTQQSISHCYGINPESHVYNIGMNHDQTQLVTASVKYIVHYDSTQRKIGEIIPVMSDSFNCVGFLPSNKVIYYSATNLMYGGKKEVIIPHFPQKEKRYVINQSASTMKTFFACHPSKNIVLCSNVKNSYYTLTPSLDLEGYTCIEDRYPKSNHLNSFMYNHDGSLLAINECNKIYLKKTVENTDSDDDSAMGFDEASINEICLYYNIAKKPKKVASYHSMAFNAHNTLALLSWENTVQFWQCCTDPLSAQLVAVLNLDQFEAIEPTFFSTKRISFSPDEKSFVLAHRENFFIFPVPFEAFYAPQKRYFLLHIYFLLKQQAFKRLPYDIKWLIMQALVPLLKKLTL